MLDSLAKNEFFDSENFQKFLMRKQGKGIRTKFLNRLTQENARDLMLEYRDQADQNTKKKLDDRVKNLDEERMEVRNIRD